MYIVFILILHLKQQQQQKKKKICTSVNLPFSHGEAMHFGHLEHLAFIIVQLWCLLSLHLFINNMYNWVAKCRGRYQPIIAQRFVQKFIILALLCLYLFGRSQKETYYLFLEIWNLKPRCPSGVFITWVVTAAESRERPWSIKLAIHLMCSVRNDRLVPHPLVIF